MERAMGAVWHDVADRVVAIVGGLPGVVAVSLGGSIASEMADETSDMDLYVYWEEPLAPAGERAERLAAVADPGSVRAGFTSWGLEDQFSVDGGPVELIYRRWVDMRADVQRAYGEGLAGNGFTTAVLYAVAHGRPLHDPTGELRAARNRLTREFPEATRMGVLRRACPLLGFHVTQLRRAQARGDLLFVQHIRGKIQLLFFDVLFALNRLYHPGEKRLLEHARRCPLRPAECETRWTRAALLPADDPALPVELGALAEELRALAKAHGGVAIPDEPL